MSQYNEAPMSFNQSYKQNNPVAPMTMSDIDRFRQRLMANISDLNENKHRMHADAYHQLNNYHHYALTIFDNMKVIRLAEASDPYNQNRKLITGDHRNMETINPYEKKMKVVYTRDGKAKFVDSPNKFKGEWEQQFDENVINPPCYLMPSSNVWGLPMK
jgi:UDP-N-acetylmuramoylalanine-D-glutamate ligase